MKLKLAVTLFFLLHSSTLLASKFSDFVRLSVGMVNVSFTETELSIEAPDPEDRQEAVLGSGSAAVISLEAAYHRPLNAKVDVFGKIITPLQPTSGSAYVFGGGGANYYFGGMSSDLLVSSPEFNLRLSSKLRYYAGGQLGVGYLIYVTETAKKSDILFDLSVHGGVIYSYKGNWGFSGEAGFGRGVGTAVTATAIRIFAGGTYTF